MCFPTKFAATMKPNKSLFLSILTLALLTGCATANVDNASPVFLKTGQTPALKKTSTASVGEVMFSQYRYLSRTGFRLDEPVNLPIGLGRIRAQQGTFLTTGTMDNKPVYCTEGRSYIDPLTGPHSSACFEATADKLTRVHATPGMVRLSKDMPRPVAFSNSEMTTTDDSSFKYELLYQGINKRTARVSYREFVRDLARPAYFQDVSYDLEDLPTVVSFRSVSIKIFSADNNTIKYEVLSGF